MTSNAVAETHSSKSDLGIDQTPPHIVKLRSNVRREGRKIILLIVGAFCASAAVTTYVNTQAKPLQIITVLAPCGNGT